MTKEQKRLRKNGIIVAVLSILLTTAVWSPLYPLAQLFLTLAHWPFFEAPEALDATGRLMLAIGGGLTTGMGTMMWVVGTEVIPVAPRAGRRVVLFSASAWFLIDSLFSIVAGSPFNAALNLIFLALMLGSLNLRETMAARERRGGIENGQKAL